LSVRLRLRRMGRKKRPFYRIVAADQRSPRDGRFIEIVGNYDPLQNPHSLDLKEDRIYYWLEKGAQPTMTVKSLLRREGIWHRLDLQKRGLSTEQIDEEMKKWEVLQIDRQKRREAARIQKSKEKQTQKAEEKEEKSTTGQAAASQITETEITPVAEAAPEVNAAAKEPEIKSEEQNTEGNKSVDQDEGKTVPEADVPEVEDQE
jgi:small subunit ribosomal protein S16